jgi:hypothetical protein
MEKRILDKVNTQNTNYVQQIVTELNRIQRNESSINDLIQWVQSNKPVDISKIDFTKRKRSKNCIPFESRCEARCAKGSGHEGEQCTRRKKAGCIYCGTHTKGVTQNIEQKTDLKKKSIWTEEYRGIIYYIDDENVYNPEDIKKNKVNPEIIGSCSKINNSYVIQLK